MRTDIDHSEIGHRHPRPERKTRRPTSSSGFDAQPPRCSTEEDPIGWAGPRSISANPFTGRWDRRSARFLSAVFLGLTLSSLVSCTSAASRHIHIVRSVFLERGVSVLPHALVQTKEGGYVIAGTSGGPWATRVSAQGTVQWRYRLPFNPSRRGQMFVDSRYTAAVTLPDDSTLLCGFGDFGTQAHPNLRGILTHLSPHGRVLSTQTLYPNNDHRYALNYLYRCVRWGRGVAVLGYTSYVWGHSIPRHDQSYFWLLKLDSQGGIQWEKLFSSASGIPAPSDMRMEVLANHDLVMTTGSTKITLIAPDGTVRAQRTIPFAMVVPSTGDQRAVHVIAGGKHITPAWLTLGEHLQDTQVAPLSAEPAEIIPYKKAYRLPDGALALFGDTTPRKYGGMGISSVAWISPNFGHKQVFTFKPWSGWIADAVPTGKPGEFATVREVSSLHHPFDRNQMGIVLSIVHVQ